MWMITQPLNNIILSSITNHTIAILNGQYEAYDYFYFSSLIYWDISIISIMIIISILIIIII